MSFREEVLRTWKKSQTYGMGISNACMGLAGETGELIDLIKKQIHHGHILDREKLTKEIGDVLYYLEIICDYTGTDTTEAQGRVIAKLRARYPEGFDSQRSINKDETKE